MGVVVEVFVAAGVSSEILVAAGPAIEALAAFNTTGQVLFLAGKSPNMRSYTAYIYGSTRSVVAFLVA